MATSEWHQLVKPVLPHITKDAEFPELSQVRIEAGGHSLYAAASDRYTMGIERHPLDRIDRGQPQPPVHVRLDDIQASLKLFSRTKDDDPPLSVTIDTVSVPVEVMGQTGRYSGLAVTLQSAAGARLVMHDRRIPGRDPLDGWQRVMSATMARAQAAALPGIDLNPGHLSRWAAAVRGGERLTLWTGPRRRDAILVTVESHFAGLWMPMTWGTGDADAPAPPDPAGLPWLAELDGVNPETGERMSDDSIRGD
jgi:hypothetical protein